MLDFGEVLRWTALFLLSCVVPFGIFVGRNTFGPSDARLSVTWNGCSASRACPMARL